MSAKDPTIYAPNRFAWEWYTWAALVALGIALVVLFWVFFDAQRKGKQVTLWKILAVIGLLATIPSVVLFFDARLTLKAAEAIKNGVAIFAWVGLGGGVLSLITILGYLLGLGVQQNRCPTCGRPLDPSWDHCPYCPPPRIPEVAPVTFPQPMPEVVPPAPTAMPQGPAFAEPMPVQAPMATATEIIRKVPQQLAWLVQLSGTRKNVDFRLGEVTNVGRDAALNDILVDETTVSRQHARIKLEGGQFVIYDLASANGTFVNGEQTQKQPLSDGDRVRLGSVDFRFMQVKTEGS